MRSVTRSLFTAFLVSCLAAPALAKGAGHFGVRGGVNFSAFSGEFGDVIEPDNRIAPNLALVYDLPLAEKLAFRGEVGWSSKGGKTTDDAADVFGNPFSHESTWRFDYIEVPLLLRGRLGTLDKVTPFIELGPTVGFAVSGKFEDDPQLIGEVDLKDDMKTVDFGWAAGAGVEFPAGPGRLGVEARYTRGFSDLFDLDNNFSTINQAWTVALSYTR